MDSDNQKYFSFYFGAAFFLQFDFIVVNVT